MQAKQIALALKIYASDHDGVYPSDSDGYGNKIQTSNDAFRNLFPAYLTSETLFGNPLSAYQTAPSDNLIKPPNEILRPGENVYSYVTGADDGKPTNTPLVVDGTDGTGRGLYVSDPKARGGVWKGARAVVIRLDNSGALENMAGPENARYIVERLPDGTTRNLLSSRGAWCQVEVARASGCKGKWPLIVQPDFDLTGAASCRGSALPPRGGSPPPAAQRLWSAPRHVAALIPATHRVVYPPAKRAIIERLRRKVYDATCRGWTRRSRVKAATCRRTPKPLRGGRRRSRRAAGSRRDYSTCLRLSKSIGPFSLVNTNPFPPLPCFCCTPDTLCPVVS